MVAPNVAQSTNTQPIVTTTDSAGVPTGVLQAGGQTFGQTLTAAQAAAVAPVYIGAWSSRPAASAVAVGAQMVITDVGVGGRSYWWSDGTYWRPVNGRVLLFQGIGSLASPISTLTLNLTAQRFTLPGGYTIPGGLIVPGSRIFAAAKTRRIGAAGTSFTTSVCLNSVDAPFGNNGSLLGITCGIINNLDVNFFGAAYFGPLATQFVRDGYSTPNNTTTGSAADVVTGNVNTANPIYFSINADATSNIDQYVLTSYSVFYEG